MISKTNITKKQQHVHNNICNIFLLLCIIFISSFGNAFTLTTTKTSTKCTIVPSSFHSLSSVTKNNVQHFTRTFITTKIPKTKRNALNKENDNDNDINDNNNTNKANEEAESLRIKAEQLRKQIRELEEKLPRSINNIKLNNNDEYIRKENDKDNDDTTRKSLKNKRVLVIGANGRLGSMVTRYLLRNHPEVKEIVASVHYVGEATTRGYGRLSYEVGAEDGVGRIGAAWSPEEERNASFEFSEDMKDYNLQNLVC